MSEWRDMMMADMSEKQLAAQNSSAKSLVEIHGEMKYLENELARYREELYRQKDDFESYKLKAEAEQQRQEKINQRRYIFTTAVALAAILIPLIVK